MKYPAIVYELDDIRNEFADDGVYLFRKRYLITLIDKNPDSLFVDKLALFPTSEFVRHYTADNLHQMCIRDSLKGIVNSFNCVLREEPSELSNYIIS